MRLSIRLPAHTPTDARQILIRLSRQSVQHPSVHLFIHPFIHPYVRPPTYPSVRLPTYPLRPSIYPPTPSVPPPPSPLPVHLLIHSFTHPFIKTSLVLNTPSTTTKAISLTIISHLTWRREEFLLINLRHSQVRQMK